MHERILIRGSCIWDGVANEMLHENAIAIEDKKILTIAKFGDLDPGSFGRLLDFSGLTLMPGLIDCHTHHSLDATLENFLDKMGDSISDLKIRAGELMKKDLQSGVTTCRTLGDKEFIDINCREAVKNGLAMGPRYLVAGKGIRAAKGHGFVGYPFNGPDEIKNAVLENVAIGADLIKIYISGTLRGTGTLPSYLTREEIETAICTSHESGLKVASHCVGGIGLDWALELGLDTLEHAYHISDYQIEKLAKSGTSPVLTLSPVLNDHVLKNYPDYLMKGHFEERDEIVSRLKALIGFGIPFSLGTDGMHGGLAREAEYAVQLGATNYQAMQAATINGAKICGIENETGSIFPGKYADIIAVEGNPFHDIKVLGKVRAVVLQGKLVVVNDLQNFIA